MLGITTNIFGQTSALMVNSNGTVVNTNASIAFPNTIVASSNGAAVSAYNPYGLADTANYLVNDTSMPMSTNNLGAFIPNPLVQLTVSTNDSSFPYNSNTNWTSYGVSNFTNSPYFAIYGGIMTNYLVGNYYLSMAQWLEYPNQANDWRIKLNVYGNSVTFLCQDGIFWYSSDYTPNSPRNVGYYQHSGGGDLMYYKFSWPTYAAHTLEIEFYQGSLMQIYVPATNTLMNVSQPTIRAIVVGDSVTEGNYGPGCNSHAQWVSQLQDKFEWYGVNLINMSESGTGYTNNGASTGDTNFVGRLLTDIIPQKPNFIIWVGGVNDNTNQLYAAATNCYYLATNGIPNVKQIVIGTWGQMISNGDTAVNSQVLSNAVTHAGLPVIWPSYSAASSWITGNYLVPNSGNAPIFYASVQSTSTHPNQMGEQFYAKMVDPFLFTNVVPNSVYQPQLW